MAVSQRRRGGPATDVRLELSTRLRRRQSEIAKAVLNRATEGESQEAVADAEYIVGSRKAAWEAVDYALSGIEMGDVPGGAIPVATSRHARLAARNGIPLDTVLQRYLAGSRVLSAVILSEVRDLPCGDLQDILEDYGLLADHLTAAIASEYMHEAERLSQPPRQRLCEKVKKLLVDTTVREDEIGYPLKGWHIGMIVRGPRGDQVILRLGKALDRLVLCVPTGDPDTFWAWLGGPCPLKPGDLATPLAARLPKGTSVALGEPRQGPDGWRLTHREALIALRVALYSPRPVTNSRDVLLLAAVVQDEYVAAALIATYLRPLEGRAEHGQALRRTLQAYFKTGQNAASAAVALKVARNTVERHLRTVESRVGQTLDTCSTQIQVALWAEELLSAVDGTLATVA